MSTNHVARAMGISPGNLYYHYRNMGQILAVLMETFAASVGEAWAVADDEVIEVRDLARPIERHFDVLVEYRVFAREAGALAVEHDVLVSAQRRLWSKGIEDVEGLLARLEAAGRLTFVPAHRRGVAEAVWTIVSFWPAHVDFGGFEFDRSARSRGVRAALDAVAPHRVSADGPRRRGDA